MRRRRYSAGSAIYGRIVLGAYDAFVLGFSCRYVWGAPAASMIAHYDANAGAVHLDVGVGTGYFLDRCTFAAPPKITLLDENANSLRFAARRLARFAPVLHRADVRAGLPPDLGRFDSIGINFVLHCLPGPMSAKGAVLARLARHLRPGGRLFGTTILGRGVTHSAIGQRLMRVYNARGIFANAEDDRSDIEQQLAAVFARYRLTVRGTVAFFTASSAAE